MPKKIEITPGTVFNDLTFIENAAGAKSLSGVPRRRAVFQCGCGNIKTLTIAQVRSGHTTSCGCRVLKVLAERNFKHGLSKSKIYIRWSSMMTRCYNVKRANYKDYGGRGIKVCDQWHDFANFYKDVGEPPFVGATLERIDNDGNYEPANVKWANQQEQTQNQRARSNSKTGVRGVSLQNGKYYARKCLNGSIFNLGTYDSMEDAKHAISRFKAEVLSK